MSLAQLDLFRDAAPWWRMYVPTHVVGVVQWAWWLDRGLDCKVSLTLYITAPDLPHVGKARAEIRRQGAKTSADLWALDSVWLYGAGNAPTWFLQNPWRFDREQLVSLGPEGVALDALGAAWASVEATGAPRRPACWRVLPEPVDPAQGGWVRDAGLPEGWPT